MKKNVKRWLALILAVAMVSGTCLAHADGFLAATDGEETQVTQESAQAVANEAGEEDKQAEQPKQEPVEEKQEIVIPKKEAAAEKAAEETAPETTAKKAEEVSIGQKVDVIPSEKKEDVYQVVFHRPAVEGGTLRVWTEGSNKKDVTYTQGKYVEEVTEGTTLYFEIESTGNYLVDSIKDQNGTEIAPTNVNGKVSSYKMVINENKEFTITYKEAPEEDADEAEAEEETGLSKAPMARAVKAATKYKVEVGKTITISGEENEDCDYEHNWESIDTSKATVSWSKENVTVTGKSKGTVTITHTYCERDHNKKREHELTTETFTVTVTGSETNPQPEETHRVYVYMKMDPNKVPAGWTQNKDGWYTIGYVDVQGLPSAKEYSGLQSKFQAMVIEAINNGGLHRFTGHASLALDLSKMQWSGGFNGGTAGLKVADGAADYSDEAPSGTNAWHLDGWYNVQKTATVYIKGNQETKSYNGNEQETTGYTITGNPNGVPTDSIQLIAGKEAKASGTDVGKYPMELKGTDFALPAGYDLVNFVVEDGWLEIIPNTEEVTIKINGHTKNETYDGTNKTVKGYTIEYPTGIDENDVHVSLKDNVKAEATGTDAETYPMNLTKDSFNVTVDNYSNVNVIVNDGSLTINPKTVILTSATDEKEYDGTALTNATVTESGDGFADGEGATYNVTGSQTIVGSSKNTFTYTLKDGTKAGNYNITKVEGDLTVKDRDADKKYDVTVTPNGDTVKYDGTAKSVSGFVNEADGKIAVTAENGITYYVTGLTAGAAGTDAGEYPVDVTETAKVEDAAGHDVTAQFNVSVGSAKLIISKRDVTLTSATETKEYDGTALTKKEVTVGGDGFVDGQGAAYDVTGSQTLVGSSENTFTYTLNEGTKADNYTITTHNGTLTVTNRDAKYEITVEANSSTDTYDGKEKSVSGFKTLEFKVNGQTYTVSGLTAEAKGTNAGTYPVNVTGTAVVTDADGNDVTAQFAVKTENGSLVINKRSVTLTSATDSKEYDGTALTNNTVTVGGDEFAEGEGATYNVTGSQTLVGSSENTFTYALNAETNAENYIITTHNGTLTVNDRNEKYEITVEANSLTDTYDGTEKTAEGLVTTTFTVGGQTYTVEGLSAKVAKTDAGTYTVKVEGTAVVKDAAKNDVTKQFTVTKKDGQLVINKRSVTLTSATDSKPYDGTALTNNEVTVGRDGFAEGEGATYTVTGSQTLAGSSDNFFEYTLNEGTKAANYEITKEEGTLTVTDRTDPYRITVEAKSSTATYDGTEKSVSGFETLEFTVNGQKYTVEGLSANASGTDADTYPAEVTGTAVVKDAGGNNVTKQFAVNTVNGQLIINKRNVTLTSATDSKPYDGTALTNGNVEAVGFVEGEGAAYTVTGSQTLVGSSENTFTYELIDGTKAGNYNITKVEGRLTVNDRPEDAKYAVTVTPNGDTVKYDGTAKSVSGFVNEADGKIAVTAENGITYYVTGLTAGAAGTDAGEYPVDVTGTAVVKDAAGHDVTAQFNVSVGSAKLIISKRDVTLTSATETKEYDGTALTKKEVTVGGDGFVDGQGAAYDVTGSQTLVGSSENTFTYTLNEGTKADNYTITTHNGTLTVTNRDAKYEITVEANSSTDTYDGKEKSVSGFKTLEFKVNGQTYTVSGLSAEAKGTNAGTYPVNVTGTAVVKDADGHDVTAQFAVTTKNGNLVINKRSVTLTSADAEKEYDGTALTNNTVTVGGDKFAEGEGAAYTVTGNQTLVGNSKNTFTYTLNEGTNADNYEIEPVEGTLTVNDRNEKYEITVEANSLTDTYDGTEKTAEGLVTTTFTVGGQTYTVEGLSAKVAKTDAGTYTVKVEGTAVVKDAAKNDVTKQFKVNKKDGELVIAKAVIEVKAIDNGKMFGQADSELNYEVTKNGVNGEKAAFSGALVRAEGEEAGTYAISQGTLALKDNGAFKVSNYELKFVPGTFEIIGVSYTVEKTLTNSGTGKDGKFVADDEAKFEIKVTNNGNYSVKDIVVLDALTGGEGTLTIDENDAYEVNGYMATIKELKAHDSVTVFVTYKVAQADVDNQNEITNVATATSPKVTDPEESGEVDVPVDERDARFSAEKKLMNEGTGENKEFQVDDVAEFDITVKNEGNVTLHDVVVTEKLDGAEIIANGNKYDIKDGKAHIATLEVDEEVVVKAIYEVTQENVDAGNDLTNIVTVEGKGPGGTDPEDKKPEEKLPVEDPAPNMSINKTMTSTNTVYRVGDTITYEIAVANTGNVTLHNVKVTDTLQNAAGEVTFERTAGVTFDGNVATIESIEPGKTVTLNCSYVVTRADAGNRIINSAVGGSNETDPTEPSTTDQADVENLYNLTINYVYAAGGTAAPSVRAQYLEGESYGYTSPTINGYTPNYAFVRTGAEGMPARDVVVTVVYTAIPTPTTPTTPTTPATPATPGGGTTAAPADGTPVGAEVRTNEDGDVEVVPVVEEDVPLAKRDLDDHKCCILHFLLMLAAMIIYAAYTRSMKKRQERIAELAEELETEKLKREQQEAAE